VIIASKRRFGSEANNIKGRLLVVFDMAQISCWFCSYEHIKTGWKEHGEQAKTFHQTAFQVPRRRTLLATKVKALIDCYVCV
jgi:hypothetical protein